MKNVNYTKDEVVEIAKIQKRFCWLYFGLLVGHLFPPIAIVFGITCIFHAYYLARSLKLNAGLYVLGVFIPLANLIILLTLIQKATEVLRENGVKVGLMGYRKEDLCTFTNKLPKETPEIVPMICPKCLKEYDETVKTCPNCNIELKDRRNY